MKLAAHVRLRGATWARVRRPREGVGADAIVPYAGAMPLALALASALAVVLALAATSVGLARAGFTAEQAER